MTEPRRYRAVTKAAEAAFSVGEFTHAFAPGEEAQWVANGSVEVVEVTYRVVGPRRVLGTEPGGTVVAALPAEQEAQLVSGGHIELVADSKGSSATKTTTKKTEG